MGLLDGRSNSYSGTSHNRRAHSPSARSVRSTHSTSRGEGYFVRPSASRSNSSSFFGLGGDDKHGRRTSSSRGLFDTGSSRGIFNFGGGSSGSSYYKRSPRQGYINYLYNKLRRMLKELWYYARRHPMKAFFAVVVPLVSMGGAIHGLMKSFGVKVPGMESGGRRGGGGYYGSQGYGGGMGGGGGLMENAGSIMQIAKAFI